MAGWRGSEEAFESHEFLAAVERALDKLPLDPRATVTQRDVKRLSTTDAAPALGIGERAPKSRRHGSASSRTSRARCGGALRERPTPVDDPSGDG